MSLDEVISDRSLISHLLELHHQSSTWFAPYYAHSLLSSGVCHCPPAAAVTLSKDCRSLLHTDSSHLPSAVQFNTIRYRITLRMTRKARWSARTCLIQSGRLIYTPGKGNRETRKLLLSDPSGWLRNHRHSAGNILSRIGYWWWLQIYGK